MAKMKPRTLTLADLSARVPGLMLEGGLPIGGSAYYGKMKSFYQYYYYSFKGWPHTRDNITNYIHRHPREHDRIYNARVQRVWPVNFARTIINKTVNAVFTEPPQYNGIVDNSDLDMFVKDSNLKGADLKTLMAQALRYVYMHGFACILLDAKPPGFVPTTIQTETSAKRMNLPYAALYNANCVVDWGYDWTNNLAYVMLLERGSMEDIATATRCNFTLVTPTNIYRIVQRKKDGSNSVEHEIHEYPHVLSEYGIIPIVTLSMARDEEDLFTAPSGISEISLIDRGIVNYTSLRDDVLYSQAFGQLIIQADSEDDIKEVNTGTATVLRYPMETNPPQFISPPESAVISINSAIENGISQVQRISDQRFADVGADTSGASKQWDFHHEEFSIFSLASIGQKGENELIKMFQLATGELKPEEASPIQSIYGTDFDLKGARAFIDDYTALVLSVALPPTAKKLGDFAAICKVLKNLNNIEKNKIMQELEDRAETEEKMGIAGVQNKFANVLEPDPNVTPEEQIEGQTTNNNVGLDKKPDNRLTGKKNDAA